MSHRETLAEALFFSRHSQVPWAEANDWWRDKMLGYADELLAPGGLIAEMIADVWDEGYGKGLHEGNMGPGENPYRKGTL